MNNLPKIQIYEEWYGEMIEELKAIRSETFKETVEASLKGRWLAGELIAKEKKIYGKEKKLAEDLGISVETVEDWVWFYKKYPYDSWDKAFAKLPDCGGKLNFSNIRKFHSHRLPANCEHEFEKVIKWRCKKCGKWVSEDPNKTSKHLPNYEEQSNKS